MIYIERLYWVGFSNAFVCFERNLRIFVIGALLPRECLTFHRSIGGREGKQINTFLTEKRYG